MLHVNEYADYHLHAYAPLPEGVESLNELSELHINDLNLLAYTYIETGIDNNIVCLYYKEKCKKVRCRVFGGLYYDRDLSNKTMPYKEQAELLLEMGCDGIKFLDMKPNYQLYCDTKMDDDVYDAMYDMLEKRQVRLVTHIADPEYFWHREKCSKYVLDIGWCFEDPKFMTQQQIFDSTIRRLQKNPKLHMCLAHFGFMAHRPELATYVMEQFPNVCFDLAPGHEIFIDFAKDPSFWHDFFTKYSDRILYGTDTCTATPADRKKLLRQTILEAASHDYNALPVPHYPDAIMCGLDLDAKTQQNILHDNFFRLLGDTPKPVNRTLYMEHAKLIRSIAEKQGNAEMVHTMDVAIQTL